MTFLFIFKEKDTGAVRTVKQEATTFTEAVGFFEDNIEAKMWELIQVTKLEK